MKFKKYNTPRKGFFRVPDPDNIYFLPGGWKQKIQEFTIIGEDNEIYITEIRTCKWGEWINEKLVKRTYKIPVGVHKTRLIQWKDGQLILCI